MDIQSSIQTLADTLKSASPSAKSILSNSIDDLKKSLDASKASFANPNILKDMKLGSTLMDVTASKKIAEENFQKLSKNLANTTKLEAIKPPTAFISSVSQQLIDGANLPSFTELLSPEDFTSTELKKLSQLTGITEFDSESLVEGIKTQIANNQGQFSAYAGTMKDSILGSDKSILSGLNSIGGSSIIQEAGSLVDKAKSYLPKELQYTLSQVENITTSQLTRKLSTITTRLSSLSDLGSSLTALLGLGSDYPEITNLDGQSVSGFGGKGLSYSDISGLYRDARAICSNVDDLNMMEYGNIKDVFDLLVSASLNGGLASLLKQLMNCTAFADKRTGYVMQGNVGRVASRGDIYTLNAIQDYVGSSGMPTPLKTARTVAANMEYNSDTISEFQSFLAANRIDPSELFVDEGSRYPQTISSQQVTYMSSKSSKLSESLIPKDIIQTAMTFLTSFI